MSMDDFSIDQLMLFCVGVAGATGALCLSIQKSKCKKLKLCCGLIDCDRDIQAIIEEEKIALGHMPTPRKEIKLDLETGVTPEPEPET